jgi:hypothetical protein
MLSMIQVFSVHSLHGSPAGTFQGRGVPLPYVTPEFGQKIPNSGTSKLETVTGEKREKLDRVFPTGKLGVSIAYSYYLYTLSLSLSLSI